MLPQDPYILLSFVNTRLRDGCSSLSDLCDDLDADPAALVERLAAIGVQYDPEQNRFR